MVKGSEPGGQGLRVWRSYSFGPFPPVGSLLKAPKGEVREERDAVFCSVLRELYEKYRSRGRLYLLEGSDLLEDLGALGADFVHPKNFGHAVIGLNLAEKLKALI